MIDKTVKVIDWIVRKMAWMLRIGDETEYGNKERKNRREKKPRPPMYNLQYFHPPTRWDRFVESGGLRRSIVFWPSCVLLLMAIVLVWMVM